MPRSLRQAKNEEIYLELDRRAKIALTKNIIQGIAAATALTGGIIVAPNLTSFICKLLYKRTRNKRYLNDRDNVRAILYRLRQQKVITMKNDPKGNICLSLTDQGKKRLLEYNLDSMNVKNPSDGIKNGGLLSSIFQKNTKWLEMQCVIK